MSTDYVDRCICGNFVTQEEVNEGNCPECGRNIRNLDKTWTEVEELAEERAAEASQE